MKKKYHILILIAIYAVSLGIRIYWLSQKEGLYIDEAYTLSLTFCKQKGIHENYDINREYKGIEVKQEGFISLNTGIKEALKDIHTLWKYNRDDPHTSLYYILLRPFLINLKSTDIHYISIRGGLLNIILFSISFLFFYLLLKLLVPGSIAAQYTGLLCAFLSAPAISNTMFIREYILQETMFIIFVYYFIKTLNDEKYIINRKFLIMSFITALTLLSGYYSVIFIGLAGLYIIIIKCKEKKYKEIFYYVLVLLLGIILAQLMYLKYLNGFFTRRGVQTVSTLSNNILYNLKISFINYARLLHNYYFTVPVIIICISGIFYIIYLFYKKKAVYKDKYILSIFGISILTMILILILAPYKYLRYVLPLYPFLSLLPVFIISRIQNKMKILSLIAAIILTISSVSNALDNKKIMYIYKNVLNWHKYRAEKNIPVYVNFTHKYVDDLKYWVLSCFVQYTNDGQTYIFIENIKDIKDSPYNEIYVMREDYGFSSEEYETVENCNFDIIKEYDLLPADYYKNNMETEHNYKYYHLSRNQRMSRNELREELLRISKEISSKEVMP
jgi:hypothetical protein